MSEIDLDALAKLAQRLRDTRSWLAAFDYPDVGTAMTVCEDGANAIDDLIDLARHTAIPSEQEPAAWRCGECGCLTFARIEERGYDGHFHPGPTVRCVSCKVVSYWPEPTHPAPATKVKVKPPKWHHEVAIGASTEEWFATTPEGQSLIVTYDESCELPWVARPFPPGASNYATANEAKAALEAAREARILSALDQGELK